MLREENKFFSFLFLVMKGKFITFEGIDGSGETTIVNFLYGRLRREHRGCINFRVY